MGGGADYRQLTPSWGGFSGGLLDRLHPGHHLCFWRSIIVPILAIQSLGGFGAVVSQVGQIRCGVQRHHDGHFLAGDHFADGLGIGLLWAAPHSGPFHGDTVSPRGAKAQMVAMFWVVLAMYGALFTGYAGVAYFADAPLENPETVFLQFTQVAYQSLDWRGAAGRRYWPPL